MPASSSTQTQSLPVALSGSCYWCMQAVLDHLVGIDDTRIGWFQVAGHKVEVVFAHWQPDVLPLDVLLTIHSALLCRGGDHALRQRYPKAVYLDVTALDEQQITTLNHHNEMSVQPLQAIESAEAKYQHLYLRHPAAPFCQRVVVPKIAKLKQSFSQWLRPDILVE